MSQERSGALTRSAVTETTGTLSNVRARIVGDRTGWLADAIVALVRGVRTARQVAGRLIRLVTAAVTPLGWAVLLTAPLALGFGYGLGIGELMIIGWLAFVLAAVAGFHLVGPARLRVGLRMEHNRVVVGDPAAMVVEVEGPARGRTLNGIVEVPVGSGLAEVAVPSLRAGTRHIGTVPVPTARRGVLDVGPAKAVRADPLGLVHREVAWTDRTVLYVHPRTIGIPSLSTGLIRDLEGSATRQLAASDIAFHALREYLPGDERRHIHWRSAARTGRYMVRQYEETRRSHLLIALSLADADYASPEEFELAVSVAGSLGTRAIADTRSITVVASERTPDYAKRTVYAVRTLSTVSRVRLLDDLSAVERAASALSIAEVARVVADRSSGVSVAFLICGSTTTATALRAASSALPVDVEVLAVVCDPERVPGLRRVPGLSVLRIGYLEDLQQALARSRAA